MANIVEYVKYYRNKTFDEVPLNEVDALIFANIAYLRLGSSVNQLPKTINEVATEYFQEMTSEKIKEEYKIYRDSHHLLNSLKETKRYKEVLITDYEKRIEQEIQFGAITFRTKDWVYIAFEGTNSIISGWKEDCHLSHRFPIPSQVLAKEYINRNIKISDKKIYIGGHSKGGNLAVAGAMKANLSIKKRITTIFDFDGPGMREKEYNSLEYKLIEPKIHKIVPNHSVIGMLMYYPPKFKTINSTAKSVLQHNPFTWPCFGSYFIEDSLSRKSARFSRDIKKFVKEYTEEEMEQFVETLFEVFKKANINQTDVMNVSKIAKCIKHIRDLKTDEKTIEKAQKLFNMLIELHK